jgi:tetratricopeptide (TPR) repeat protein
VANELQEQLAVKVAGRAPDARRAVYDQAREALQNEVRAAAPFMPVQTVVARRRELESAIAAVEREASRKDAPADVVARAAAGNVTAAADAAKPEIVTTAAPASANVEAEVPLKPDVQMEFALGVAAALQDAEALAEAMEKPLKPAAVYASTPAPVPLQQQRKTQTLQELREQQYSSPHRARAAEADAPEPAADISDEIPEDVERFLAAEKRRRSLTIYLGVIALVICAGALAFVLIGLGLQEPQKAARSASPRIPAPAALPPPQRPEAPIIKGAGFQDAAQQAMKLANSLLARCDYPGAITAFDDAIRLDPGNAVALGNRAFAYMNTGDIKSAIRDYGAAIDRDPGNTTLRYNRAVALNRAAEHARAIEDLDRVLAADPVNADALNSRCWARAVLAHLNEALADCNEAAKLRPKDAEILDSRGFVFLRLGRLDRSIDDYNEVLRMQPKHVGALYGRGLARIGRGDRAGGQEDVAAARAIDPDIPAKFASYGIR